MEIRSSIVVLGLAAVVLALLAFQGPTRVRHAQTEFAFAAGRQVPVDRGFHSQRNYIRYAPTPPGSALSRERVARELSHFGGTEEIFNLNGQRGSNTLTPGPEGFIRLPLRRGTATK